MEVIEFKVRLHCKACEKAVRRALCGIAGVKCVETDMVLNKITVLGYLDRRVVIKAVQRTGRKAELLSLSSRLPSPFVGCSLEVEEQSPRLPRGFLCILPRFGYYYRRSSAMKSNASSVALSSKKLKAYM